mgnify:CR=1 FL=1
MWYGTDRILIEFEQYPDFEVCTLGKLISEIEDGFIAQEDITQLCVAYPGSQLNNYGFGEDLELPKFSRIVPNLKRLRLVGLHMFVHGVDQW